MTSKPIVGIVGLGAMGRGVSACLLAAGFPVVGHDIQPDALAWIAQQGGQATASLTTLAHQTQTIISFVVNAEQTEAVLFGHDGLVKHLDSNSVFIACSTMDPGYVGGLATRLAERKITLIDAPVTGGAVGAAAGTLTIMGSGPQQTFEAIRPILQAFGANVHYLGPAGSGARMKVLNQLLCGVHLAAVGEVLALAKRQELPLDLTLEILTSGSAASWMLADRGPRMIQADNRTVTSTIDIFVKDLSLVLDTARQMRFPAAMAHAAYLAFLSASARGLGNADDSTITTQYDFAMCDTPCQVGQGDET